MECGSARPPFRRGVAAASQEVRKWQRSRSKPQGVKPFGRACPLGQADLRNPTTS
eukprot:CAMPEP_0204154664 /NCGR_PEP_ID=MMETSP0361-20130328/28915_1 /ASSEMBLY_ACC=CAM_ASM_000343 /TAXON_ID=268821 /ORGANISM="Scrippsiella Hangoei, Strain SHTV-5" /LENGTH=54 /DNA_ID=CAMNT_0051109975 /DNA_START=265 /DNA_END=425 /DNA_ORIENTATION=+